MIYIVWSFSKNFRKMNLMKNIQNKEKKQNKIYSLLFEKEEESNSKRKFLKNKKERNKNNIIISENVSKKCNSLLSSIYDKINLINLKTAQLSHINSLSLQKISKKYYRMNSKKTSSSLKHLKNNYGTMNFMHSTNYYNSSNNFNRNKWINEENILNQKRTIKSGYLKSNNFKINDNNKNFNNTQKYNINNKRIISSIFKNKEEKLKKFTTINIEELYKLNDKKFINMDRFNDAFRIEMNNTFYKFNPKTHLKQLNEIQRDNISLRKNMEKIKSKINNRLGDLCSKNGTIKQNNKIKDEKAKSIKAISFRNFKNFKTGKVPLNIKFNSQRNILPYGYKARALYENYTHSSENKKNKEINKKGKNYKDKNLQKIIDIKDKNDLLDKTLRKLYNSLDTKNIIKYINDIKDEKFNNNKNFENNKKNKYFPAFKEIKQYLKKVEMNKLSNDDENKKEEIEKYMIDLENKLLKNINENKKKLIENIDIINNS